MDDDSDDDTDTQTTSSSSVSTQFTERDLQAKVSQLETMFPNISRGLLEEALNFSNGDYEGAVDHVMQHQASVEKGSELTEISFYRRLKIACYVKFCVSIACWLLLLVYSECLCYIDGLHCNG